MPTVTLPGIGPVEKKWVYVGGAIAATIVGIAWWRHLRGSGAAAGPVVDPATGSTGGGDSFANPVKVGPSSGAAEAPSAPSSDQEWVQRVLADFGNLGLDSAGVLAVLGKYLSHQGLTSDEAAIVRQAWAFEGRPPGNQEIILATGGSTPGTAGAPATPTGFRVANQTKGNGVSVTFAWDNATGATDYKIRLTSGFGWRERDVSGNSYTEQGLAGGTAHHAQLVATNSSGDSAPAVLDFTTI